MFPFLKWNTVFPPPPLFNHVSKLTSPCPMEFAVLVVTDAGGMERLAGSRQGNKRKECDTSVLRRPSSREWGLKGQDEDFTASVWRRDLRRRLRRESSVRLAQ